MVAARTALVVPMLALAGLLAGCGGSADGSDASSPGTLRIVTDVYPTAYAAKAIGGDAVDVVLLTQPGVEPHDLELSPSQVAEVARADLVAHIPGLIPAVSAAVRAEAADRAVDVTSGITRLEAPDGEAGGDPHVWLDPRNVAAMGKAIAAALTARGLGSGWDTEGLASAMATLDSEYRTRLAGCTIKPLVVSHEAFGYLAKAYGFQQQALSGLSPEAEPTPARLAEISRLVRDEGVTTVYYEALVSPAAAEAVAAETGARTATLDPIEGSTDGRSYDELMRANLEALAAGQGCS